MEKTLQLFFKNRMFLLLLLAIFLGSFTSLSAQTNTYTGASGGNWSVSSNWSLGSAPVLDHDVVIPDNRDVIINVASAICKTLTIKTGANNNNVSVGANTLTVTGTLSIEKATANNKNKIVSVTSGRLNCGSIIMGNSNGGSKDCRVTVTSGTITVSGDIDMNGNANENQIILDGITTGGTLNMGGNFTGPGGDIVPGNFSTVNFNGTSAQTIPMNGNFVYNNIITNNAVGALFSADVTAARVKGNITVQTGILNNGGRSVTGNPTKIFTVANGASFILSGTTSAFPTGFGTNTLGETSTVTYGGTAAQSIIDVVSPGYGNLIISGSNTKTAAGSLDIQGNVTVNSGSTLAFSAHNHTILGNLANNGIATTTTGTINITGNWTNAGIFTGGTTSTVNLTGDLLNSGTLTAGTGASNLNINGNWANNNIFTAGSNGTVTFNSTTTGKIISGTTKGLLGKFNNLIFNGTGGGWTIANDLDVAKTFLVTNGAVNMSGILLVEGTTAVTIGSGGSLTLENSASLIQSGYTGVNSGDIIVKRNSSPIIRNDYTYWSSPTTGTQTLLNFSPATQTSKFYTYHNAWSYAAPATSTFTKGIGYGICAPQSISASVPAIVTHKFTGVPNNGDVDVTVAVGPPISNRLIGNPYPSGMNADAFILANLAGVGTINQTISGTLYFWTHNHTLSGNNYSSSDYGTYNLAGGTAVATGSGNTSAPTSYIASGQGFFVHTIANGNVSFRNSMRTGTSNSNFYKSANATTSETTLEKHRIWLNFTNSASGFSQALVGYVETATNDYNPGLDGLYYGADQHVLYSLINDNAFTIQARTLPFVDADIVPLGFKTNIAGNKTISIDHVDGLFSDTQNIYIEDLLLNVTHDLKQAPYTFSSLAGTFNNRFILRYVNTVLGLEDFEDLSNSITVASKDQQIKIKSQGESIEQVIIYDILGRQIFENKKVNSNEALISDLISHQTLIIKIILSNGQIATKKLVY